MRVFTVSASGQITLPKKYRDQLQCHTYIVDMRGGEIVLKPIYLSPSPPAATKKNKSSLFKAIYKPPSSSSKSIALDVDRLLYES